jgi:hypothetical protein
MISVLPLTRLLFTALTIENLDPFYWKSFDFAQSVRYFSPCYSSDFWDAAAT